MPTTASNTFSSQGVQPLYDPANALVQHVKLQNSTTYVKGQVLGEKIGTNSLQRIEITGIPTGGNFTLTFAAQTTAAITWVGLSALNIQNAFEALSTVGKGNTKVTLNGTDVGASILIEFVGTLGCAAQSAITCSIGSLTGGTPAQAVTQTQVGAAGTPGSFDKLNPAAITGEQIAKAILEYDCVVDGSGNITVGGGEHGETSKSAPAFFSGTFAIQDLTGLTPQAVVDMGGRVISGNFVAATNGVVRFG